VSTRKVSQIPGRKVRPISREAVFNINKGLNNNGSPNLIDNKEWSDLLNVQFDEGGVVRKRWGYKTFGNTLSSARGLGEFKSDTVKQVLTIDGSTFKYSTGGNWTDVATISFTPNQEVSFTQARAKTYIWNSVQGGAEWDGAALARPGTMPRAGFSVFYNSYHIASGALGQSSRVYISRLTNSSIFTNTSSGTVLQNSTEVPGATVFDGSGANFIDVNKDDGDVITALGVFQDTLIIFKQFSIYQMNFDDNGDPVVIPITRAAGCVAPRSVVAVENDLYFLSRDGVRFLGNEPNFFNSVRTSILSKNIEPIIDSIKPDSYAKASAVYYDNQYILSVPDMQGNVTMTLVYHKEFRAWSKWSNVNADAYSKFVDTNNELRLVFLNDNGDQCYEFTPNVYNDNGLPIRAYVLSKVFDFRNPDITKYFVDLGLMFRTISGEVDVEIYTEGNVLFGGTVGIGGNPVTDGMAISPLGEVMLGLGGGEASDDIEAFADTVRRVMLKTKSTTIRFKIENNRTNENFVLLGYIHGFYPYGHFLFSSDKKIYL
jgi:hypothetical protein